MSQYLSTLQYAFKILFVPYFRAHAVFTVVIEQRERQSSKVGVRSVIQLVDCAGSDDISSPDASVQAG